MHMRNKSSIAKCSRKIIRFLELHSMLYNKTNWNENEFPSMMNFPVNGISQNEFFPFSGNLFAIQTHTQPRYKRTASRLFRAYGQFKSKMNFPLFSCLSFSLTSFFHFPKRLENSELHFGSVFSRSLSAKLKTITYSAAVILFSIILSAAQEWNR